jgi:hypothetical protein
VPERLNQAPAGRRLHRHATAATGHTTRQSVPRSRITTSRLALAREGYADGGSHGFWGVGTPSPLTASRWAASPNPGARVESLLRGFKPRARGCRLPSPLCEALPCKGGVSPYVGQESHTIDQPSRLCRPGPGPPPTPGRLRRHLPWAADRGPGEPEPPSRARTRGTSRKVTG